MKAITALICGLVSLAASVHAAPGPTLEDIKQIRCESTVSYDEDTPNEKTAAQGVKIFTPGSRKDVKPRAGAFLLAEFDRAEGGEQEANQQFYFSPVKGNKLSFHFIAAWKARGELKLGADSTATGFINQKSHVTELTCTIRTK